MNDKIIGIIGGMGPEATVDFYLKIIKATKVKKDQDHFRVIIDSNVKIPDRTEAILGIGENPVKAIVQTAKNLERLGVEISCMPCMTAHYFIEEVQKEVNHPILNVFIELRNHIMSHYPNATKIGVLATSGTIKAGLFEKYLTNNKIIYPSPFTQKEKVMKAIYGESGIKSGVIEGEPLQLLKEAAFEIIDQGAELIISGCTEIGLVLKPHHINKPLIDPMDVVANEIILNKDYIYSNSV